MQASQKVLTLLNGLVVQVDDQLQTLRNGEAVQNSQYVGQKATYQAKIDGGSSAITDAQRAVASQQQTRQEANAALAQQQALQGQLAKDLQSTQKDCKQKMRDYQDLDSNLNQESQALEEAMDVIQNARRGGKISFLQIVSRHDGPVSVASQSALHVASHVVRLLASNVQSTDMIQFAGKLDFTIHALQQAGDDPIARVRQLLQGMLTKLRSAGTAEADHQAWCTNELKRAADSKAAKQLTAGQYDASIQSATARQTTLTAEMNTLRSDIAQLAQLISDMTSLRNDETKDHQSQIDENNNAIKAVQAAIGVLQSFYGADSDKLSSRGGAVIALLQQIEADMTETVASIKQNEQDAQATFKKESDSNTAAQQQKKGLIASKQIEINSLSSDIIGFKSDLARVQDELSAIADYTNQLNSQCGAPPYNPDRIKAEIAGLQQALAALESS